MLYCDNNFSYTPKYLKLEDEKTRKIWVPMEKAK
jgi:hypothetical protein